MRVLQIIESAYRGTLEEQDDTIVWLSHCLRDAGAPLSVLLKDNAVNYVLRGEDSSGLRFGRWTQTNPPCVSGQLTALLAKGVPVYVVREDLERRAIADASHIEGVRIIAREDVPSLTEEHDQVWHW